MLRVHSHLLLILCDVAQLSAWSGRGILSESQGPVWMIGTASEHHVEYQYQLAGASNHYLGLIQTESVRLINGRNMNTETDITPHYSPTSSLTHPLPRPSSPIPSTRTPLAIVDQPGR